MGLKLVFFLVFSLLVRITFGQAELIFSEEDKITNLSISAHFSYYKVLDNSISLDSILENPRVLGEELEFKNDVENLDFTTATYWLNFKLTNTNDKIKPIIFETARPITNEVTLFELKRTRTEPYKTYFSGDGIPFEKKAMFNVNSLFPLELESHSTTEYWLKLSSDGEVLTVPMIFWEKDKFQEVQLGKQFSSGVFYGIFIFVILIYTTFYVLLKDLSFIIYVLYVFCSGFMHFSLDGYSHHHLFSSGGYWAQHFILLIAGFTSILIALYAINYLKLKVNFRKIYFGLVILIAAIFISTIASLIPGKPYEIAYFLINGFSLLGTVAILLSAIYVGVIRRNVNYLFILGMTILISSAVVFILGNFSVINAPNFTQVALKFGTLLEIIVLSIMMAGKYKTLQDEKEEAQLILLKELEGANEKLENQVALRTSEIKAKSTELEVKNNDILASIKYAKRIQDAVLPSQEIIDRLLPNSFVYFKPRDIVSGDFYYVDEVGFQDRKLTVYATADCTGHGVPGAFVSIVGSCFLSLANHSENVNSAGEVLDFLNNKINETFNAKYSKLRISDGMDIALCVIDRKMNKLYFSGAKNPVIIVRNNEAITIKGDSKAIGMNYALEEEKFTTHEIDLVKNDMIYTFSDGYPDQFGGPKGKKFMYGKLRKMLVEISSLSSEKQLNSIQEKFESWKGEEEQIDDVLLIGVRY